ncbi:multimerin-2 [Lates japonicus]|uniref:Multimerin-2 n=1 Tax=Lates japonicus TaxID=270547 RepID=A0AAD3MYR0_LATJO|nr:multimerin-2 [Lates japonicus]
MTAVGELVLVLGLLVSAHCEVRARDPEVEEEEELGGRAAAKGDGGGGPGVGGFGMAAFPPHHERLDLGVTETPPEGERGDLPARSGNWCAFVQKRLVTMAVVCGTEKYTIKSQSPCPSGIPDCQLVMYKLSTRPVYTQKQKILTALQWRCCPGHGGDNCEDTVHDPQLDSQSSALIGGSGAERAETAELLTPDVQAQIQQQQQQQQGDPNREQNDYQVPTSELHDASYPSNQHNATHPARDPGHAPNPHLTSHQATNTYPHQHPNHHQHQHQHRQQGHHLPAVDGVDDGALPYPEAPAVLPVPHMMALVMSQLQPILQGFNHSLEHLSQQVGDLARDVAQLKSSQREVEPQAEPLEEPELDEAVVEHAKLDEVFQHIKEVQRQMESQRTDMEDRLHSLHAMLHYNLTSFKTDIDMKLKRHQKMLQVSLQAMNTTLTELKLDQDQTTEMQLDDHLSSPSLPPPWLPQPSDSSALWKTTEQLDNMVVNNTVKVTGLMEDMEVTSGDVQQLRRDFKMLEKQINETARRTQVLFMETGLEVDAAKVGVLRRVEELAGNLTQHAKQLQEVDVDMDYLYNAFYQNVSGGDCDCKGLKAAVARLERSVANVTTLANENRLALDENSEGEVGLWDGASDWEPAVEALQRSLQQVKESVASEQSRTRALDHRLTQLSSSVTVSLAEVYGLKENDKKLSDEMLHLSGSFNSLLKDAIRHSDVLERLLGEEVLEFLEWPNQDQEAYSIQVLKEQLRQLEEQLKGHNQSITSLLANRPGGREEVAPNDQPSSPSHPDPDEWLPGGMSRSNSGVPARERQLLLHPEGRHLEHGLDGSDLWNLEKTVEELGRKVLRLAEKPCPCPNTSTEREVLSGNVDAKLQAEVIWLKRGLEEHLRMFKNVFSNADVLAGSDATLELDKLWQLVKNKDGKKEKKRGGGGREGSGRGANHRSRRDSLGVAPVPSSLSEHSLLFVAGSPLSVSNSILMFEPSLNQRQFYSDTGTFMAPVDGIYLFILTLDLRLGPARVVLRRGSGGPLVSLHRQEVTEAGPATAVGLLPLREGEEVRLELRGGEWVESEDNVFTGMLLHQTP